MRKLIALIILTLGLAACGQEAPALNPDGTPAPQQASSGGGFLAPFLGAMGGSMVGNMLSRPSAPAYHSAPTTVVNRTYIIKQAPKPAVKVPTYTQRPSANQTRAFSGGSRSFSSPSRSFSGGRR